MSLAEAKRQKDAYVEILKNVSRNRPQVKVIEIGGYLCKDDACSMTKGEDILYRDNNHLNLIGSMYIGKQMVEDNPEIFKTQSFAR